MTSTLIAPRHLRRTMEEIDERIKTSERGARDVLLYALDYTHAQKHFAGLSWSHPSSDQWAMARMIDVKQEAHGTFLVILREAVEHRDTMRWQVERLREYVWLLGRDDVLAEMDAVIEHPTSIPALHAFAIHMGGRFTRSWMAEEQENEYLARLAAGLPCRPECRRCEVAS